jgi:hypothetical protein
VAKEFLGFVVAEAQRLKLTSDEHFTVYGTLLEACANLKSFQKVNGGEEPPAYDPGNPTVDFHGEKQSNRTNASSSDSPGTGQTLTMHPCAGNGPRLLLAGRAMRSERPLSLACAKRSLSRLMEPPTAGENYTTSLSFF